jgi:molybdenum cofactor cytidylyltransferase
MAVKPKIAAIVLAAGFSRRFGEANKLQAEMHGDSVLSHSLQAYQAAPLARRIAVTQAASPLARVCRDAGFETVDNLRAEDGMGTSIAAAMRVLDDETHVLIGLADMPRLRSETVNRLCAQADDASSRIIIPTHKGVRGHPRLFGEAHFTAFKQLAGDKGGKEIIAACPDCCALAVDDAGILLDIDTPDQLAALAASTS